MKHHIDSLHSTSSSESRSPTSQTTLFAGGKSGWHVDDDQLTVEDEGAASATRAEHDLTLRQGLRTHKKAVFWSVFLSTAVIMEGFDLVLITGFFGLDRFEQKFGSPIIVPANAKTPRSSNGTEYEVSAAWKAAFTNGALVGELIGLWLCGLLAEKLGCKKTMIAALAFITATIFLLFFAKNAAMILAGQILCGIPWGVFQTLPNTYASDICPIGLRPYLTTYINFAWVMGQLLGSVVARGTLHLSGDWSWRLPLGLQWIWPIPLIVGIAFAPESPWWLVRHDRKEEARRVLQSLYSKPGKTTSKDGDPDSTQGSAQHADDTLDLVVRTNAREAKLVAGTSYRDGFRRAHGNARRTEVTCAAWSIQTLCGSSLMYFSTSF